VNKNKIIKYLNGTSSPILTRKVEAWINTSVENAKAFYIIKSEYIVSTFEETSKSTDHKKGFANYKNNIQQSIYNKHKKARSLFFKYAAILVLVFGIGTIFYFEIFKLNADIVLKDNVIKLELEGGNTQVITAEGAIEIIDSKGMKVGAQEGESLVYKNNNIKETLEFNTLKVPYGKRFNLVLSDGTQIVLNAGTSLKYPIQFIKGKNREVYLKGEAFFKVAKDTADSFIVNTNGLDVNVLGTVFNVSAYPEDNSTNTVLTEGSVKIQLKGEEMGVQKPILLKPGHLAAWKKSQKNISINAVDVNDYISWVEGTMVFKSKPFSEILKVLERHYDVYITNNYDFLNDQKFLAKFDSETIEEILQSFQNSEDFLYTIDGNKIEINPPINIKPMK
tara:strand:- start:17017 stop:18192 length:1176 start_codon:yes stop_codon:yes gene_type:complete